MRGVDQRIEVTIPARDLRRSVAKDLAHRAGQFLVALIPVGATHEIHELVEDPLRMTVTARIRYQWNGGALTPPVYSREEATSPVVISLESFMEMLS